MCHSKPGQEYLLFTAKRRRRNKASMATTRTLSLAKYHFRPFRVMTGRLETIQIYSTRLYPSRKHILRQILSPLKTSKLQSPNPWTGLTSLMLLPVTLKSCQLAAMLLLKASPMTSSQAFLPSSAPSRSMKPLLIRQNMTKPMIKVKNLLLY
jgi:hypothetical protein